MTHLNRLIVATCILALSAPVAAAAVELRPASAARAASASPTSSHRAVETPSADLAQSYAARESSSKDLERFEGGSIVYVAVPLGIVVLGVILLVVLL